MNRWPEPTLRHVARLTDDVGIVEHARLAVPQPELGYCTDDAGRALAVAVALPGDPDSRRVATVALRFLQRAHAGDGRFRLRLGADQRWTADAWSDDAAGRALLGLGTAAANAPWSDVRGGARELFDAVTPFRSGHPRAMAAAALGALELLRADGDDGAALLLADAAAALPRRSPDPSWPWPEHRLTYANALVPHAALAVAVAAGRGRDADEALALLRWLVDEETLGDHFSFTPVAGRGPGDARPGFDQQPIEAWAMADACAAAHALTGDAFWAEAVERAARWFLGANDVGVAVFDASTGGGYDGLQPAGVNLNQGAESTLAFVATMAAVRTVHVEVR